MIAILWAIWEFLVALGPFLTALAGVILSIGTAIWEITKIYAIIMILAAAVEILFDPRGKTRVGNFLANIVGGALGMAQPLLSALTPSLKGIVQAFATAFATTGPGLADTISKPLGIFAATALGKTIGNLEGITESTPDNAVTQAAAAIDNAFALGMSSAVVTAAFESMFPERLNTLNGIGPMLASMAGFGEVSAEIRGPLYRAAFGKSAQYKFNAQFKPDYPDEADAVKWHSRRLLDDAGLQTIFGFSGLKPEYEKPYITAAYRPVPPFLLARAAEAGFIPADALTAALQFGGFRDADIAALQTAYAELALQPYRTSALSAYKRAFELGTRSASDFADDLDYLKIPADAQVIIQVECAGRKLEQLAELYRKSISEAYKYGQISDAQYIPALEGIGIGAADAQAHYAIDSIAKTGKAMAAELKAEEKLAMQRQRAGIAAAIAEFRAGDPGEAELLAKLLGLGVDPVIAAFIVSAQSARVAGSMIYLYGVELTRAAALVLRENVMALEEQYKKQLIDDTQAAAGMSALGIPERNATPLLAQWAAGKMKATTTGERLPR